MEDETRDEEGREGGGGGHDYGNDDSVVNGDSADDIQREER